MLKNKYIKQGGKLKAWVSGNDLEVLYISYGSVLSTCNGW